MSTHRSRRSLPCLSLHQPWAWAVGEGLKHFENRTWQTRYRGPLLIHAAKSVSVTEYAKAKAFIESRRPALRDWVPNSEALPRGGLVAAGELVEIYDKDGPSVSPWHIEGMFGWQLGHVIRLPFRAMRGSQGLFYVTITKEESQLLAAGGIQ